MSSEDRRIEGRQFSLARFEFEQQTIPATGTTAQTETLANINGTIVAIEIITSDTEDGATYTVALTTANGASLFSKASLADNSNHWLDAVSDTNPRDADFNPIPVNGTITVTVTPDKSPDAADLVAPTVQVILYME